jgi:exodeoxyribonuclease VII small subunit
MNPRSPEGQGTGVDATPPATDAKDAKDADDASLAGSFEESVRRLATIVEELEAGDLSLERSLELFEEGVRLARAAQERLDRAERRVEELLGVDGQGRPVLRALSG